MFQHISHIEEPFLVITEYPVIFVLPSLSLLSKNKSGRYLKLLANWL